MKKNLRQLIAGMIAAGFAVCAPAVALAGAADSSQLGAGNAFVHATTGMQHANQQSGLSDRLFTLMQNWALSHATSTGSRGLGLGNDNASSTPHDGLGQGVDNGGNGANVGSNQAPGVNGSQGSNGSQSSGNSSNSNGGATAGNGGNGGDGGASAAGGLVRAGSVVTNANTVNLLNAILVRIEL